MRRTNTFDVRPLSDTDERLLRNVLDASAALWNETNYERRQAFFGRHDHHDSVWDVDDKAIYARYTGVLGAAVTRSVIRKNDQAWRSFFTLKEDPETCHKAHPPGYWGNEEDGRELRTYVRNDSYTLRWGNRSRLEIPVGEDLKDEYNHTGRLRLEVCGTPRWQGKQGQLELQYDETATTYRAFQPVTIDTSRLDSPLADETAALDVGANNIVACTTSTGRQFLYQGRDLFARFRETTHEIASYQEQLTDGQYSSHRIRSLYRRRTRRRDHAMNTLVRDLVQRLHEVGVLTVYVGDLTGILDTHWSVEVNAKTHNFWKHRGFIGRLEETAEEYGITVTEQSEANTTRECPVCGERADTIRSGDDFWCPCGYEGHADVDASAKFLTQCSKRPRRPMARPARFEWDDHDWSESPRSHDSPKESRANLRVASVGTAEPRPPA